jgi:hypothetical protein
MERFGDGFKIRIDISGDNFEQWVLLMSDEHFDSIHCDRRLLKRHHEEAKERGAIILKFGDVFDCMGGKYDPRSHKGLIRPELQKRNYFDAIIDEATKFYTPYKDNIAFISMGNHEYSILKRQETNLISRLCERLDALEGNYRGFIRFQFSRHSGTRSSKDMYYSHGSGGGAAVTRGVIKTNRRQDMAVADFYVSGHSHMEFNLTRPMGYMTQIGFIKVKEPEHVSLGTYMSSYMKGSWADGKEFAPESMGGAWLRFFTRIEVNENGNKQSVVKHEIIRAK